MKPIITIALCIVLLLVGIFTLLNPDVLQTGALQTDAVLRGEVWRIVTSTYLHAGLPHLWLNLMLLCFIGFGLEPRIGHGRFLLIFLLGDLGGSLLHLLTENPQAYALGASGGLYALLTALIVELHFSRATLTPLERVYLYALVTLAWAGIVLGLGVNLLPNFPFQAGNAAHIGGGLTGLLLGYGSIRRRLALG